jgi:hypothetical protein
MTTDQSEDGIVREDEPFGIGNEFTGAQVSKVWTQQGERLRLFIPRNGNQILLDAMQLEVIAAQDPERFSELFAKTLGSDERGI